ncbi:MAG: cyanoexosortase A system-associated protein [Cyanobacteria bacterium J06635_1]
MRLGKLFYHSLLISTLGGVFFVLISTLLLPPRKNPGFTTTYRFSDAAPLSDWTYVDSQALELASPPKRSFVDGKRYRYRQNEFQLNVDMRYLVDTDAHIPILFQKYAVLSGLSLIQHHKTKLGFHGLFESEQQAHLSACINPRGGSTFTRQQFSKNRLIQDLHPGSILPWLMGLRPFRDRRCLWTDLSISLEEISEEEAYELLEMAWPEIYQWWQPRFPDS